jgi:pimeloyl-ACP methyl ester carboxylesterase
MHAFLKSGFVMNLLAIAGIAFAIYALIVLYVFVTQRNLLYFPERGRPDLARAGVADMQIIELTAADGVKLSAWFKHAAPGKPNMLYLHGNAGNLERCGEKLRPYLDAGLGVLALDYRGYGMSQGQPNETGLYADARAALDFLAEKPVILYGESLGSGVAVEMAVERPVAALILEAPFTSIGDAGAVHYPWLPTRWLSIDKFDSAAKISRFNGPILVLHGERDPTVPAAQGKRLLELAGSRAEGVFFPQGDHVNLHELGSAKLVLDFIARRVK